MIKEIVLNKIATFSEEIKVTPKRINYIYGGNGAGKTSISRLISNPSLYPDSKVLWDKNPLKVFVYNKDFVKENFEEDHVKGVFTLGKDVPETKEKIDEFKKNLDEKIAEHEGIENSILKTQSTILEEINAFQEELWPLRLKHTEQFKLAMSGSIGTRQLFKEKCVSEQENTSDLKEINFLLKKYNSLYITEKQEISKVTNVSVIDIKSIEEDEVFKEPIIGKSQTQIRILIDKLSNSDWVNTGLSFLANTDNNECPFCQRPMDKNLIKEIEEYFDESYQERCDYLDKVTNNYINTVQTSIEALKQISERKIDVYTFVNLPTQISLIEKTFEYNKNLIETKKSKKSTSITLESIDKYLQAAIDEINICNNRIEEHNKVISNIPQEKTTFVSQLWKHIADEAKTIVNKYLLKLKKLNDALLVIKTKKNTIEASIVSIRKNISDLEATITSVTHTVNEINRILQGFHFQGFKLSESTKKGHYQIVRPNGTIVKDTLSEGEYTFISFLYFYHLVKGSIESSGVTDRRVVVIDDPISSLDSNILFIVSNLVKSLIEECLDNYRKATIRQIFISTHNIYFHKEVTFKGQRENPTQNEIFWIVYKTDEISAVKLSNKNPINTTYALLWDEIKNSQNDSV